MVEYKYDAWGNHAVQVIDETCSELSQLNPFRYRGYYYDTETGLYFLKTRYYDPEVGRFITIDDLSYLDPDTINGINLYAYCGNNPVMRTDSNGSSWWSDFWDGFLTAICTVLIVAAVVVLSVATMGVGAAVTGALGGGLIASIIGGAVGGAITGAIFGAGISIVSQGLTNGYGNISWEQVGKDTLSGAVSGAIAGGVFGAIKHVASAAKIARGLSGLTKAENNVSKASQALKDVPMKIKGGVMSTERIAAQLSYDSAMQALGVAQSANNAIFNVVKVFYKLGQFGFKQLIGGPLETAIWGA